MHLAVSVFRAIENRVPLARAVEHGVSAMIDGNGRVLNRAAQAQARHPRGRRPARRPHSALFLLGRLARPICLAVTIGLVPLAFLKPRLGRASSQE